MTAPATLSWSRALSLSPGDVLSSLQLQPVTATQLTFYCGAAGVTDPIHFDRDFAKRFGFRDAVVNGSLRVAWISAAATRLVDDPDFLSFLSVSHKGPMFFGDAPLIEIKLRGVEQNSSKDRIVVTCGAEARAGGSVCDEAEVRLTIAKKT